MNSKNRISLALSLLTLAAPTFAIPLAYDFTGTVQSRTLFDAATGTSISDTSWIGLSFTARMVIDTDRFTSPIVGDFTAWRDQYQITDSNPVSPWSGALTIGGNAIDVQPYAGNYSYVQVQDTKGPQSCGDGCSFGVPDSLTVVARSDLQGALGTNASSLFQLNAYQPIDFSNPDPASSTYIDLTQPFSLDGLLTMPLPNLSFSYGTSTFDCQEIGCFFQASDTTRFNIATVTRTDLSAVSVPEPGTLTLLGAGLLALWLTRRRSAHGGFAAV